jgi:type I site-specific restriction endonuclease
MAQLHTGFLIYSNKRSELTAGMQETMTQLQQLLKLVLQDTHEQPTNKQQQQQPAKHQDDSADSQDPQQADSNDSSTSKFSRSSSACMPNKAADAVASGKHSAVPSTDVMLQNLEDADALLQQLSRQVWCLREASRCLIFQYCNVLDPLQLSMSAVHAWPYIVQPPPLLEVLVRQQVARQQREDSATDEEG